MRSRKKFSVLSFAILLAITALLVGTVVILQGDMSLPEGLNLLPQTEGIVTSVRFVDDEDGDYYRILFTYEMAGATYSAEEQINGSRRRPTEGDRVPVYYLPIYPAFGALSYHKPFRAVMMGLLVTLVAAYFMVRAASGSFTGSPDLQSD